MEDAIDLSLQSIHGVGWRPGWRSGHGASYTTDLSGIKAYVSFSGSVPNMKVSSFAMCFETGSLLIESNTPKVIAVENEGEESELEGRKFLDVAFADPFREERQDKIQSSNRSFSSEISGSSYQPHLQFSLRDDDLQTKSDGDKSDSGSDKFLKFHVVFRSVDDGVIAEGVANLEFPGSNSEGLPLTVDLPIIQITKANSHRTPPKSIYFDESACIRVHIQDSPKQQDTSSLQNSSLNEILLSDNVDEIHLKGMVKKIHEQEGMGMQKVNYFPTKLKAFGSGNINTERRRFWAFGCGGTIDLKHSVESFLGGVRGFRTKCTDEEDPKLFTSHTMESTILTRDSLEI